MGHRAYFWIVALGVALAASWSCSSEPSREREPTPTGDLDAGAEGDAHGDADGSCVSHRVGSCVTTDGLECFALDGDAWDAEVGGEHCPTLEFHEGCGCPAEGVTGSCTFNVGTADELVSFTYAEDPVDDFKYCLGLGEWQSNAETGDLSQVCVTTRVAVDDVGGRYDACTADWACGTGGDVFSIWCEVDPDGPEDSYSCRCVEGGADTATFIASGACGAPAAGATIEEKAAAVEPLLTAFTGTECGWTLGDTSNPKADQLEMIGM